ncbi:ABC transporter substrate-binding protein [Indibacter alkaliphilus]|nr:helical backbone metal receptor [Indibacter alkaliphilus]
MNRRIEIPKRPERIISLVPSQTELLVDLGLEDRLVGLTKFCVHPKGLKKQKSIIGGTKSFHFDKIEALQPDLVIGNKEENYQEGIDRLSEKYPVWMSDIYDLEGAFNMMQGIGEITGTSEEADTLVQKIRQNMNITQPKLGSAIYLIWKDPLMVAGRNTFINDMLQKAGFENLVINQRYPELTVEEIRRLDPDYLLLSSEPFPFKQKHIYEFGELLPDTKILLVDGEMFSWYGSRLLYLTAYLKKLQTSFN